MEAFLIVLDSLGLVFAQLSKKQKYSSQGEQEKIAVVEATIVVSVETTKDRLVAHDHKTNDLTIVVSDLVKMVKNVQEIQVELMDILIQVKVNDLDNAINGEEARETGRSCRLEKEK